MPDDLEPWLAFSIYSLACFRLAVMLSDDSGPAKIFSRFRAYLKREEKHHPALRKSDVATGIQCQRCSSVWIAAPISIFAATHERLPVWLAAVGDIFCLLMALSAAAVLLNRAFQLRA